MSTLAPPRITIPRLMLAGGGTGGHVYPALAVLDEIEGDRRWIGSIGGREEPLVRRADIDFVGVPTGAVLGRGPIALAGSALRNGRGVLAARAAIRAYHPNVVLGTGGYISVPAILAARTLGVPSALFLPDVKPGLAVKVLSRVADRVACTAEVTRRYLPPGKAVPTGYPVRADVRAWADSVGARSSARTQFGLSSEERLILIMGGSSGARSINHAVGAGLPRLLAMGTLLHVAGTSGVAEAWARREELPPEQRARYLVEEYLHEKMGAAMAAADVIVCRAGASILGELPVFGLPAVLVPGTFAGGHQRHNADYLVDAGTAVRVDDESLRDPGTLPRAIASLLETPDRLDAMRRAARALDRPDAAANVAQMLADLAAGGTR